MQIEKLIEGITLDDVLGVDSLEVNHAIAAHGWSRKTGWILFSEPHGNAKAIKAKRVGYMEFTLGLRADQHTFRIGNQERTVITCPHATHGDTGCAKPCLVSSGQNRWAAAKSAKDRRTQWLATDPVTFLSRLFFEIHKARKLADKMGYRCLVRLNTYSDIRWERVAPWIFSEAPDVLFLDYTKWPPGTRTDLPQNYTLACSVQGHRHDIDYWQRCIDRGHSVSAIVDYPQVLVGARPDLFVDATADDAWILRHRDNPTVGVLKPISPLRIGHATVYSSAQILADGVFHQPGNTATAVAIA